MNANELQRLKNILWILSGVGFITGIYRFIVGLGPTTALSDSTPWGFWIGFDVMGGVALAAGGFVLAGLVYIFHLERFRPVLRPAILTAWLGYLAVVVGLLCDLGLPWHIINPIFNWQHHSVMFEVAWCVILYTVVLTLEFAPVILEHSWFNRPLFRALANWLHRAIIPLVIAGIVLSTLHQSSLGALTLIMPYRLYPLWYSPAITVLFFTSAIALGLMMVILEGSFSAKLHNHPFDLDLYSKLGAMAAVMLWLYLALRLGDLFMRRVLPSALDGSWQSIFFLFEIGLSSLIPAALLSLRKVRENRSGLILAAIFTVLGVLLNRLSTSVIAVYHPDGVTYFPAWIEFSVSVGIVSAAILAFIYLNEYLPVFGEDRCLTPVRPSLYEKPLFDPTTKVHIDNSLRALMSRRSVGAILLLGLVIVFLPGPRMQLNTPVVQARGWDILHIDGNKAGRFTDFPHADHQARQLEKYPDDEEQACGVCHHLSKPGDGPTSCWECHTDMYYPTSIFNHSDHQEVLGGNKSCSECHTGEHTAATATACQTCHEKMIPGPQEESFNFYAPGYKEAMHGLCISCHQKQAVQLEKPELAQCANCHHAPREDDLALISISSQ
ncbi:MAG: hypothetical protein Fur0043_08130 [Anaerolineales bacterium]